MTTDGQLSFGASHDAADAEYFADLHFSSQSDLHVVKGDASNPSGVHRAIELRADPF